MKHIAVTTLLFLIVLIAHAQFPAIKWYYNTNDASFGQSAAGDIDGDGNLEVVFGCYRNDSCVYALNAENGTLLWKYNSHTSGAEGCNDVAMLIYDVDGDDSLDVVVPSSCNPRTFCFRGTNGTIKWQTGTAGSDSPPTIGDIDEDGNDEILHGGFDGHVLCLNANNGAIKWSLTVNNNSWVQTAPTIADLDNDGHPDFVVATWAFSGDTSKVYAYRGIDHSLLWSRPLPDVVYHGTAVSDLEDDGFIELVIGCYDGKLYVLNGENGSIAWTVQGQYYIGAPAVIADLDGDEICEIIYSDAYGVGAIRNNGANMWYYTIPDYGTAFRGVAVAKINNDNSPDVVFGTSNGKLIVINGLTGSLIWSLDLAAHFGNTFEIDHAPLIADFDNNDTIDVFIVGGYTQYPDFQNNYGRAYMISAGLGTGPEWLMFQNDPMRRSNICNAPFVDVPETFPQKEIIIYPNPANDFFYAEITDDFSHYEILSIEGRVMQKGQLNKGKNMIYTKCLVPGVYFIRTFNAHNNSVNRIIKM